MSQFSKIPIDLIRNWQERIGAYFTRKDQAETIAAEWTFAENIDMGGNRITNAGRAIGATDVLTLEQAQEIMANGEYRGEIPVYARISSSTLQFVDEVHATSSTPQTNKLYFLIADATLGTLGVRKAGSIFLFNGTSYVCDNTLGTFNAESAAAEPNGALMNCYYAILISPLSGDVLPNYAGGEDASWSAGQLLKWNGTYDTGGSNDNTGRWNRAGSLSQIPLSTKTLAGRFKPNNGIDENGNIDLETANNPLALIGTDGFKKLIMNFASSCLKVASGVLYVKYQDSETVGITENSSGIIATVKDASITLAKLASEVTTAIASAISTAITALTDLSISANAKGTLGSGTVNSQLAALEKRATSYSISTAGQGAGLNSGRIVALGKTGQSTTNSGYAIEVSVSIYEGDIAIWMGSYEVTPGAAYGDLANAVILNAKAPQMIGGSVEPKYQLCYYWTGTEAVIFFRRNDGLTTSGLLSLSYTIFDPSGTWTHMGTFHASSHEYATSPNAVSVFIPSVLRAEMDTMYNSLNGRLDIIESEVDAHTDAILDLQIEQADHETRLGTAETNITNEATARASADSALQTNITNEATARASADSALQTNVDLKIAKGNEYAEFTPTLTSATNTTGYVDVALPRALRVSSISDKRKLGNVYLCGIKVNNHTDIYDILETSTDVWQTLRLKHAGFGGDVDFDGTNFVIGFEYKD